jgi:hypothetical protein
VTEGDEERLPRSIGGLVDYAFAALGARAPFYLLVAVIVFAIEAAVEFAIPVAKADSPQGLIKLEALTYAAMVGDAFATAAVALGVATRLAGEEASSRRIAGAAVERWLPVLLATLIVQTVVSLTAPLSGLGRIPDPAALVFLTAPFVWLLWGVLSLAVPITALSGERPLFAVITGLTRAIGLSLRPYNLVRLCIVSFVTIVPSLAQTVAYDLLSQQPHQIPRILFWANTPIDALTVVPVAAIQTVFAIDFARRVAGQRAA